MPRENLTRKMIAIGATKRRFIMGAMINEGSTNTETDVEFFRLIGD
jgi:hypothetical protein